MTVCRNNIEHVSSFTQRILDCSLLQYFKIRACCFIYRLIASESPPYLFKDAKKVPIRKESNNDFLFYSNYVIIQVFVILFSCVIFLMNGLYLIKLIELIILLKQMYFTMVICFSSNNLKLHIDKMDQN